VAARLYKLDYAEKGFNAPITGCVIFLVVWPTKLHFLLQPHIITSCKQSHSSYHRSCKLYIFYLVVAITMLQSDNSLQTPFLSWTNVSELCTQSSDHLDVTVATVRCHRLQFDDTEMLCFYVFSDLFLFLYKNTCRCYTLTTCSMDLTQALSPSPDAHFWTRRRSKL
jgi:hypothetical protein